MITNASVLITNGLLAGCLLAFPGTLIHAQTSGSGSSTPQSSSSAPQTPQNDNSFPEDVSSKAAKDSAAQKKKDSQASDDSQQTKPPALAPDDNAFPEDQSRKAASDAKSASETPEPAAANGGSGVSSSGDYDHRMTGNGRTAVPTNVPMPHVQGKDPAKEDVNVGTYYLQTGNFRGAYERFKEATQLAPENMDAVFGLAEAARHLKHADEAATNYQLFLQVVISGSKAKEARKGLALVAKDK